MDTDKRKPPNSPPPVNQEQVFQYRQRRLQHIQGIIPQSVHRSVLDVGGGLADQLEEGARSRLKF